MMTAKEEDILTSRNLVQKNIALDKVLESLIINKAIDPEEMFSCDRNAAFFAIRRMAYGDRYDSTLSCPRCNKENNVVIDLSKMDNRPFSTDGYTRGENKFTFILPTSGVVVTFKILTRKDEVAIEQDLAGMVKASPEYSRDVTTRLSRIITSVDGVPDRTRIRKFVGEELRAVDSLAFRRHIRSTMPDIDTTFDFHCEHCGLERRESAPIGLSFFWPE
jgi:transcription elongation factor Elf1